MTQTQLKEKARKLTALSLDGEGQVDPERVEAVLATLRERKPLGHLALLRLYRRFIEREERKSRARLEYAGKPSEEALQSIGAELTRIYARNVHVEATENPELLAGLRVHVADDVYDASVRGRLRALARRIA